MKNCKVESVFRERDLLRNLIHPNIVKQYNTFQDDQNVYFVFEYANKGSLGRLISKMGKMPKELCVYYAAEILSAIEYMILNGVVHRDLKPENILIAEDWHLKIVKFENIIVLD